MSQKVVKFPIVQCLGKS